MARSDDPFLSRLRGDNAYIDVSFFGDGMITYYGCAAHEALEAKGAPQFSRTNLPKNLLEVISRA